MMKLNQDDSYWIFYYDRYNGYVKIYVGVVNEVLESKRIVVILADLFLLKKKSANAYHRLTRVKHVSKEILKKGIND